MAKPLGSPRIRGSWLLAALPDRSPDRTETELNVTVPPITVPCMHERQGPDRYLKRECLCDDSFSGSLSLRRDSPRLTHRLAVRGRRFTASCLPHRVGGAGLPVGSTSVSSRNAGGRATPGTGPRITRIVAGVAEAGEVDRRVQIPIQGRTSVAAVVDPVPQRQLGFHSAAGTRLGGREPAARGHQRGPVPNRLVAQLDADPAQSSIVDRTIQAAFAGTATPGHPRNMEILDNQHRVPAGESGGGGV